MLHQWATGSDAAAIAKLGEMYGAAGGTWEQTAVSGHTANTLAKLRADVVAGNAPAAVQLKGPEILGTGTIRFALTNVLCGDRAARDDWAELRVAVAWAVMELGVRAADQGIVIAI